MTSSCVSGCRSSALAVLGSKMWSAMSNKNGSWNSSLAARAETPLALWYRRFSIKVTEVPIWDRVFSQLRIESARYPQQSQTSQFRLARRTSSRAREAARRKVAQEVWERRETQMQSGSRYPPRESDIA